MKRNTTLVLLIGALIAGLGAAYFANLYIDGQILERKAALEKDYSPTDIVVPKVDLRVGDVLGGHNMAVRKVPKAFVHAEAVRPADFEVIAGRRLAHPVNAGEALLMFHVSEGRGAGFSTLIPEGSRALTFPVDMINAVSGMLRPGDQIDLVVTLRDGNKNKTFPLLSNVEVMATGDQVDEVSVDGRAARFQSVTLMVSSEDAARITLARKEGDLNVMLRGRDDDSPSYEEMITVDKLLGKVEKARPAGKRRVQVIRGGKG